MAQKLIEKATWASIGEQGLPVITTTSFDRVLIPSNSLAVLIYIGGILY
ncbi:hypothetical protein D3OALGA1CA_217 [Olavius algarvensis associated proteobacterium Delta 3]|nr:hypothetical protein D3OALGA1CA_217 [Olavius algarvensis associated proteobacterium Delta 3]